MISLIPLQHEPDNAKHLMSHSNNSLLTTLPPGISLVELSESFIMKPGNLSSLNQNPTNKPVPLPGAPASHNPFTRLANAWSQTSPRNQPLITTETVNITDLSNQQRSSKTTHKSGKPQWD